MKKYVVRLVTYENAIIDGEVFEAADEKKHWNYISIDVIVQGFRKDTTINTLLKIGFLTNSYKLTYRLRGERKWHENFI